MRILKDKIKSIQVFVFVFIFLFCAFSFIPFNFADAEESVEDFDMFNSSLIDMIEKYDEPVSATFSTRAQADDVEEENVETQINRLIVSSSEKVETCGAIAKAEYKDLHIFQYKDATDAQNAFEFFCNSNLIVSYDAVTTVENVTVESVYNSTNVFATNDNPWADKTFNSWGAKYVGYKNYVDTMVRGNAEFNEVVVAVLDSGINTSHELLKDRILHNGARDFTGERSTTSYAYEDLNSHGSHVSGIIADATLDNVKILPLKVLRGDGKGTVAMIVSALEYVKTLKASGVEIKALNMSIGVESEDGRPISNRSLENAVVNVYKSGIVPVVSAGNESMDTSYACPANVKEAITVSALKESRGKLVFDTSYSNYGSFVDFSAPGTWIYSAAKGESDAYVEMKGTSMAAPHVTACVALIYSNFTYKDYGVDEIYDLLKENAVDLGEENWDKYYGHGCVNVSNIGIKPIGYVNFSVTEEFKNSETQECFEDPFSLTFEYITDLEGEVEIYYTLETEEGTNVSETKKYDGPIEISKTTRVTAVAYVNGLGGTLAQSYVSSNTYYFNNTDLLSNFEFEDGKITKYNGKLTTLNLPATYDNKRVFGIGENAFNLSNVEVLNIQTVLSIFTIDNFAFEGNSHIKEIHCNANSVQVEAYAFYKCVNLQVVDIPHILSVGDNAFAYCRNLQQLQLLWVESIGRNALSGSGLNQIYIGKNVTTIGNQTMLSLTKIFGYAQTSAQEFAYQHNIQFVDMTLRFTKDLNSRLIVKESEAFDLQVSTVGLNVKFNVNRLEFEEKVESNNIEYDYTLSSSGLSEGIYNVYVTITDQYNTYSVSRQMEIEVVKDLSNVFSVNFNESGLYGVYIDDDLICTSGLFHKNSAHTIKISPLDGFELKNVVVNGEKLSQELFQLTDCIISVDKASDDLLIEVEAGPKTTLLVTFETENNGKVYVGENAVETTYAQRDENLSFKIVANEGWIVKRVTANDTILRAQSANVYLLENISSDVLVKVVFIKQFNDVEVICGKGGNISSSGLVENGNLEYGASRTYTISANHGYVVDFVSVNGERVGVVGNSFEVINNSNNENDVISVVVSFKKADDVGLSNTVLNYFIVFAVLFVIFLVAKIVLYVVRKHSKEISKN